MPREEAVSAYIAGRISRRTFIRHLVAAGVSVGAALTYSEVLVPNKAVSQPVGRGQDFYDHYGGASGGQSSSSSSGRRSRGVGDPGDDPGAATPVIRTPGITG